MKDEFYCKNCFTTQPMRLRSNTKQNNHYMCVTCEAKANKNKAEAIEKAKQELAMNLDVRQETMTCEKVIRSAQVRERLDSLSFENELANIERESFSYDL